MSATMTAPLALSRSGDGSLLLLTCDWTQVRNPGISPAWALLRRLADVGPGQLDVHHTGNPPHFLDLLQKLHVERHAAYSRAPPATLERLVEKLGRWSVLQ